MANNEPPGSTSVISLESVTVASVATGGHDYTYEHATKSIIVAMVVNFVIAIIKFFAYMLTRSSAMLSESLHSMGDSLNSVALLTGIKLSQKQPDKTHPFGYGLETSVWALVACVLLLVFAGISVYEGWHRFQEPVHAPTSNGNLFDGFYVAVLVLVISIGLEIFAVQRASQAVLEEVGIESKGFQAVLLAPKHIKQVIGPTTRFVFYEDWIALLGAFIALVAIVSSQTAVEYGWLPLSVAHWPDSIASILIGFMLMGMAVYLFTMNRSILTGTAAAPKIEKRITDLVVGINGVSEIHDLKTVDRGPAGLTIHMKVEVEPDTMVKDVDDLTERIKQKLQSRLNNVSSVFIEVLADESDVEWGEKFNALIEQGRKEDVLNTREEAILRNFQDFMEATAEDIMVPRTDVAAIEINTPLAEVSDMISECGYSRIPVYEETMDAIKGVVFARDVFDCIRKNRLETPLSALLRDIDIFPENKRLSDLLEDFKRRKIQMAVVADEHGGFAGIVTLENLLEEIVGDIWDENDEEEEWLFEMTSPESVLVSGRYDIGELNEKLNLEIPSEDFVTIGGYVFGVLGREPEIGDVIDYEDLKMSVVEMDGHRIEQVRINSPVPFLCELPNLDSED